MATPKTKTPNPALQFLVDALRRNPNAKYADLAARAKEKKLTVWPIMFGRAQVVTGIVKAKPRGSGKAAKAAKARKAASLPTAEVAAPTPSRAPTTSSASDLFERLDEVARSFRDAIVAALGAASVSDIARIVAGASGTESRLGQSASIAGTIARRGGASEGAGSPFKDSVIEVLTASAVPLTKHQIARKVRATDQRVKDALVALRKGGHVTLSGNRRMAVYSAM